jgi:GNAT superfamily N-acetyltransferase
MHIYDRVIPTGSRERLVRRIVDRDSLTFWARHTDDMNDWFATKINSDGLLNAQVENWNDRLDYQDGALPFEPPVRHANGARRVRTTVSIRIQDLLSKESGIGRALLGELEKFAWRLTLRGESTLPNVVIHGKAVPEDGVRGGLEGLLEFYRKCGYEIVGTDGVRKTLTRPEWP